MFGYEPKRIKKVAIIQEVECHNSWNNFGKDPPQECARILGSEAVGYFQRRCWLKNFLPYGLMFKKNGKNPN